MRQGTLLLLLIFNLLALENAIGQDLSPGFKNWLSIGADMEVSKKLTLNVGQMYCLDTKPYELQFSQLSLGGEYRILKNTYLEGGWESFFFRTGTDFDLYHKLYTGLIFRKFLGLPFKQNVEAELFLPQQKKYRFRFNYSLSYSLKNKFLPWRGRPYAKGQVSYYLGGKPLTYYGENEEAIAYHAPNDFHRFRFTGGLSLHPAKNWNLSIFYLWNKEFNTSLTNNRDLNNPNQDGTKIKYPFNNYSVAGVSLRYDIKLYSNDKQKTKKEHHRSRG